MRTLLTYTSLDKTYNNQEVKGSIALYSIHVEKSKTIPNTFNLEVDGLVVYLKNGELAATNLIIPLGSYTLKELETKFQTGIDLKLSIELNELC